MALETAGFQDRLDLALKKADLLGRGGSHRLIAIGLTRSGAELTREQRYEQRRRIEIHQDRPPSPDHPDSTLGFPLSYGFD
jgi:hypothetical protein